MLSAAQARLPPELRRLVFEYADDTLANIVKAGDDYHYHRLLKLTGWETEDQLGKWENAVGGAWREYRNVHSYYYCGYQCAYQSGAHKETKGCTKPECTRNLHFCDCRVCGEARFLHKPSRS